MENKYFTELARCLNKDGISTGQQDGGKLPILLEGEEVGIVVPGGGLRVRKESLEEPEASELYHRAGAIAAEVHEYMELMENAPPLKAVSLSDSYKLLADFNGHVLGGMESERGVQFTTWQWTFDKAGLTLGHYFENDYAAAKKDFAVRAGLVQTDRLFTEEQLTELYRGSEFLLDEGPELTSRQAEALTSARKQIKEAVPDLRERLEQGQTQNPTLNM